jgi:hypothetical protein
MVIIPPERTDSGHTRPESQFAAHSGCTLNESSGVRGPIVVPLAAPAPCVTCVPDQAKRQPACLETSFFANRFPSLADESPKATCPSAPCLFGRCHLFEAAQNEPDADASSLSCLPCNRGISIPLSAASRPRATSSTSPGIPPPLETTTCRWQLCRTMQPWK